MQKTALAVIIVALLIVGGGIWWYSTKQMPGDAATGAADTQTLGDTNSQEEARAPMSESVTYTAEGFAPATVTIKRGGTVTWTNNGGGAMWVASAQHPTHTVYAGTSLSEHCGGTASASFDQCGNGAAYSFTFDKEGEWAYHNHSNARHFGKVIVVE